MTNPIQIIKDLTQSALGGINAAATLADLEEVRVAVQASSPGTSSDSEASACQV